MKKFIRLDVKGEWRNTEHRSMRLGIGDDCFCEGECTCAGEGRYILFII